MGEFEELLLVSIATLNNQAYGVMVARFINDKASRNVGSSAIHSVLKRLEQKGYLKSKMGGATKERGGREKRYFTLTARGISALEATMNLKISLYNEVLKFSFVRPKQVKKEVSADKCM